MQSIGYSKLAQLAITWAYWLVCDTTQADSLTEQSGYEMVNKSLLEPLDPRVTVSITKAVASGQQPSESHTPGEQTSLKENSQVTKQVYTQGKIKQGLVKGEKSTQGPGPRKTTKRQKLPMSGPSCHLQQSSSQPA